MRVKNNRWFLSPTARVQLCEKKKPGPVSISTFRGRCQCAGESQSQSDRPKAPPSVLGWPMREIGTGRNFIHFILSFSIRNGPQFGERERERESRVATLSLVFEDVFSNTQHSSFFESIPTATATATAGISSTVLRVLCFSLTSHHRYMYTHTYQKPISK